MSQHYSDPKREADEHALPDVEVFTLSVCDECGCYDEEDMCSCDAEVSEKWFYWFCFPGCLPDSEPNGPFETKAEAVKDAQEGRE